MKPQCKTTIKMYKTHIKIKIYYLVEFEDFIYNKYKLYLKINNQNLYI